MSVVDEVLTLKYAGSLNNERRLEKNEKGDKSQHELEANDEGRVKTFKGISEIHCTICVTGFEGVGVRNLFFFATHAYFQINMMMLCMRKM